MAEDKSSVAQVEDPHPPEKILHFRFFNGDVEYLTKRQGVKAPKYESREAFDQHQGMLRKFQSSTSVDSYKVLLRIHGIESDSDESGDDSSLNGEENVSDESEEDSSLNGEENVSGDNGDDIMEEKEDTDNDVKEEIDTENDELQAMRKPLARPEKIHLSKRQERRIRKCAARLAARGNVEEASATEDEYSDSDNDNNSDWGPEVAKILTQMTNEESGADAAAVREMIQARSKRNAGMNGRPAIDDKLIDALTLMTIREEKREKKNVLEAWRTLRNRDADTPDVKGFWLKTMRTFDAKIMLRMAYMAKVQQGIRAGKSGWCNFCGQHPASILCRAFMHYPERLEKLKESKERCVKCMSKDCYMATKKNKSACLKHHKGLTCYFCYMENDHATEMCPENVNDVDLFMLYC